MQQDHDGPRNIRAELETATARLRDTKARPENLLTLFHAPPMTLNKRTVYFRPNRSDGIFRFELTNIADGHGSHLLGAYSIPESSQLSPTICTYLA